MSFFKKHKWEIIILLGLILIYFVSRFCSILSLPIFTDEAIYIRWAQIAKQDANWRFISLTDGKQPMFIWLMAVSLRFIQDPLLAGRIVSVGAGFLTLIGMYFLGREVFKSNKVGLVSSALYVVFPMAMVYDRMALYDGLVGAFAVWALFLIILLVRNLKMDIALILGMVAGGGVLTKTNAFFSIYLLPVSLILFDWNKKELKTRLIKWVFLAVIAVVITYAFYSILRLSPFFHIINEKNAIFVYPFGEWIAHPFEFFIGNCWAFWDWTTKYLTWPLFIIVFLSFFINKAFLKEKLVLFLWFILPLIALGLFGKTLYPRFIFFMMLSLLPLIAFFLVNIYSRFKNKYFFAILSLLIFLFAFITDYLILTDFSKAYIPVADVKQYQASWEAGTGIRKSVDFFAKEAENKKIYIATQGTFGLMPFAFEIYLIKNPNITIKGYWPIENKIPAEVIEESKKNPTYFFFYQPCIGCEKVGTSPVSWGLKAVLQIKNKAGYYTTIYKVK
jgi:4-amino-4-deoxy-L-arabinose transferase-like glycosyltransferase